MNHKNRMPYRRKNHVGKEMREKTISKTEKKLIRKTIKFSLTYLKKKGNYVLFDVENYEPMALTKEEVEFHELAMVNGKEFNRICEELFL